MEQRKLGRSGPGVSALGLGFLAGRIRTLDDLAPNDWRRNNPRFQGENFAKNLAIADRVHQLANEKGCTPAQLALGWLLTKPDVIPIPGTSCAARLEENVRAIDVWLMEEDIAHIEQALPRGAAGRSSSLWDRFTRRKRR